ncbi:hypothetical protein GCM10008959_36800 [Deinococcus seoulensis]|uniref:DNA methylase N-4/N-6 domain-containing protein n=1 Tax=Deinococcus seoulensis TaxID=1837379 RepID=A0ABQ2S045_9DEIO|nr:hypothetical protein [Deinococcus seoulensis]GGR71796.1 hypothetical protein GCM10008959_36800 [Deinococcus seoulensis]
MPRPGHTWTTYTQIVRWIAGHYGQAHDPAPGTPEQDEQLMTRFMQDLGAGHLDFQPITDVTGVSYRHFRHHLRYLARWGVTRRTLLAGGANFQLLEKLNVEERDGQLEGLALSGTLPTQRRQLAQHLAGQVPGPHVQETGWLAPDPQTRRTPRLYGARDIAWVYGDHEVEFAEGLHPAVARSLIAQYLPGPGVIADPMAGSGTVAVTATRMGHTAWASDRFPAQPFIREVNLLGEDLVDVLEQTPHPHVDLMFLHPPLPGSLDLIADGFEQSDEGYAAWLNAILDSTVHALRGGAHLVLILPLGIPTALLLRIETQLLASLKVNFELERPTLAARHLAVARSGREGWHLLVARNPELPEEVSA